MRYGYSYETNRDALRYTNTKRVPKGITIHHWGSTGSGFNGILNWFCADRAVQTSAHYVAQGSDANGTTNRRVACIVAPTLIAWHAGLWSANVTDIGIECRPEATDADYDVVAELVARLWVTYGVLPVRPHKQWVSTACPGRYNIDRIKREATVKYGLLKGGQELPTTTPPAPPAPPAPPPAAPTEEDELMALTVKHPVTGKQVPLADAIWSVWTYVLAVRDLSVTARDLGYSNAAQLKAVTAALTAHDAGDEVDLAAVQEAARLGVEEALAAAKDPS